MDFATKTASSLIAILVLSTGVVSQSPAVVQNPTEQSANSRIAAINEANRLIMQIQELCKKGKCNSALPLAKRAVDLRQTTLGDHFETAWALKVLAYVYSQREEFNDAAACYERVIATYQASEGRRTMNAASAADAAATLWYAAREFHRAEADFKLAMTITGESLGQASPAYKRAVFRLVDFYFLLHDQVKASQQYEQLLAVYQSLPDKTLLKPALDGYTCFLYETRSVKDAEELLRSARMRYPTAENLPVAEETVLNAKAIHIPHPDYHPDGRVEGADGIVLVRVKVDENGRVTSASAICGHPALRKHSEELAYGARFKPTVVNGSAVPISGFLRFGYTDFFPQITIKIDGAVITGKP